MRYAWKGRSLNKLDFAYDQNHTDLDLNLKNPNKFQNTDMWFRILDYLKVIFQAYSKYGML